MTEGTLDGGALQLIAVCLFDGSDEVIDEASEPVKRLPVASHLRPSEARALAFDLLELAELADRRTEACE